MGTQYAIEVQRKAGDSFVVQSTYHRLKAYLAMHYHVVCSQHDSVVPSAQRMLVEIEPTEQEEEACSPESIAPHLAMANVIGLEAEAAAGLAKFVKSGQSSAQQVLKSPDQAASALKGLLETGSSW